MATNENFMVPYQPAAKSQGFQTQQAPDITAQLRQNQQVAQQNFINIQNSVEQQARLDKLDALGPFSETLNKVLTQYGERRATKEKEEGIAQFYEDQAAQEQALIAHEQQIAPIQKLDGEFSTAAADAMRQGVPFSVADKLKEYSGWKRYGYAEAAAISMGEGYKSWMLSQRQSNQGTITLYPGTPEAKTVKLNDQLLNTAESAAVRAHLRNQYLVGSGLANLSQGLQAKAFKTMRAADVELQGLAEKNYAIRKSDEERDIVIRNLLLEGHADHLNLSTAFPKLAATVDQYGLPLGNKGAQKLLRQVFIDQAAAGQEVDFTKLENQVVSWDPKKRTFKEMYGKPGQWLGNLKLEVAKGRLQYDQLVESQMNQEAQKFQTDVAEQLLNRPGGFTKEDVESFQPMYQKLSGGRRSSVLDNLAKNDSNDAKYIEMRQKEAEVKATTGMLSAEYVNTLPNELRGTYTQLLQAQEQLVETPQVKKQIEAITGLVKGKSANTFIAKNMGVDLLVENSLQQQYKGLVKLGMEPLAAFKQISDIYKAGTVDPSSIYYIKGGDYPNFLKKAGQSAVQFQGRKAEIDKQIKTGGFFQALKDPNFKPLTEEEHTLIEKTYGTTAFRWPLILEMYRKRYNTSELSIVNQLRANMKKPPLAYPAPRFVANAVLNQKLLNRYQTPLRAVRAVTTNWSDPTKVRNSIRPTFVGSTGLSTGPHLDYRVWDVQAKRYVNPDPFMHLLSVNGKPVRGNFPVTSGYGPRTHPVTGQRGKMHYGIDLGMAEGTQVDVAAEFIEKIDDPTAGIMTIYGFTDNNRQYELHTLHGQRR